MELLKMSDKTKSCNLTELEIKTLIAATMQQTLNSANVDSLNLDDRIDRINYLNKRLKTFNEADKGTEVSTVTEQSNPAVNTGAWPNG